MIKVVKPVFLVFAFILSFIVSGCNRNNEPEINYRDKMRQFVINISDYAKMLRPGFIVIPQNGQELIIEEGKVSDNIFFNYLNAIDGVGREDLFYGYNKDDKPTPEYEQHYMIDFCNILLTYNKTVLVTDYCNTPSTIDDSYSKNHNLNYISFAATERNLNVIPQYPTIPFNENTNDIVKLSFAKNFLYLINSENFESKNDFISALGNTNYDIVIIDLFHNEDQFSANEIELMKTKSNGSKRLVICYLSIGEAEEYRYYWNTNWKQNSPAWLAKENPNWKGNYKVKYWDNEWQKIIFGFNNSYVDKIINSKFDGVYLDIIDAFEYFENN